MDIKDSRPSGESDRIETPTEGVASGAAEIDAIGFGSTMRIDDLEVDRTLAVTHLDGGDSHKLGQLKATAICGNDITSSCLYVAALCAVFAGPYAPLSLAVVAATLYLFRNVYAEVCSALPLNGGAYNALLNTTTKAKASVAACLTLLSYMATAVISASEGMHSVGPILHRWISIDATLVLSGAVLTSYVGVIGLVRRMSLDRCLPQVLLARNKSRGTNHLIILLFFALCCVVLALTAGRIELLAGVYTISFLGVMALFAIGNILLKVKRSRLPRAVRAGWPSVLVALAAVVVGIVGNVLINPDYVRIFLVFFVTALAVVGVMLYRVHLLTGALAASRLIVEKLGWSGRLFDDWIVRQINRINSHEVIYFSRGDSISGLNHAALYVLENEITKRLMVVHCYERDDDIWEELPAQLQVLDRIYPELRIDFLLVKGRFGPQLIEAFPAD